MNQILLLSGVVIILSVFLHKLSMKMGVPVLLAFLLLGIVFGIDGVFKIHFENFELSGSVCSFGLIFIMFSGGFGKVCGWRGCSFIESWRSIYRLIGSRFLYSASSYGVLLGTASRLAHRLNRCGIRLLYPSFQKTELKGQDGIPAGI